jgi:hypothetical protein
VSDRSYLIGFEDDPTGGFPNLSPLLNQAGWHRPEHDTVGISAMRPYVYGQARWEKKGVQYPIWVDDATECWSRGFIPFTLLRPEDTGDEVDHWVESAIPDDGVATVEAVRTIERRRKSCRRIIDDFRTKVREFNLPYLALPPQTPKEVALDVFIKMNTSSVRLSTYDIVVALVEEETGKSLHERVEQLRLTVPRASEYADLPGLVLDVVALRQNRIPSQAGYSGIDYKRLLTEWDVVVSGIKGMVSFLEEESVFDAERLPSLHGHSDYCGALGTPACTTGQAR